VLRSEKDAKIKEVAEIISGNPYVYLTRDSGLSANLSNELRGKVRETGGSYKVINNRLTRLAAEGTGFAQINEQLTGPIAIATHKDDPVGLAKALVDFAKDNPQLEIFAGVIESDQVVDANDVKTLSKLPGLLELRGQIAALINTPATMLVRLLGTPATQIVRVLGANQEKQEGDS
jgi:large subunit ribosomal protein L10